MKKLSFFLLVFLIVSLALFIPSSHICRAQEQKVFGNPNLPAWKNITVTEDSDFVIVDNADGFVFKFRKGTAGYNEIWQNGSVVVYDERWELQYLFKTDDWRLRGESRYVTWQQPEPYHAVVKRFYDDFAGTTFNITYSFYGGFRPKIAFEGYIGQTSTYRLVWKATGINKTYVQSESSNCQVKFWNEGEEPVVFDYSDVYRTFGNITTVEIEPWANNHKLNEIFNVGLLNMGSFRLDPNFGYETKGTTEESWGGYIVGSWFTCPEAGIAQSITTYLKQYLPKTPNVKYAIYMKSDNSLIGYTEQWTVTTGWNDWKTLNIVSGGTLAANTDYYLVFWSNDLVYSYSVAETTKGAYDSETYNGFPDPWSPTGYNSKYSIYCTYGIAPEYDYVDQLSNVDGIGDKGSHSNFTAQKYGPDSIFDTLTEVGGPVTLRPNAAGYWQGWSTFGDTVHWSLTSDQLDSTGVQVTGSTTLKETENLQDTNQTGTINSVTAYLRAKESGETLVYDTITFDAANSTILTSAATSMSWEHTTGTNNNRILLVDIGVFNSAETPATVTSITYSGTALTQVATDVYSTNPQVRGYLYRLVNPASGTKTISVSFSASTLAVGGSVTYFNVDQTNPVQSSGSAKNSGTAQSVSLTPTGTYSKIFYANMLSYRTASPSAYTVTEGTGQTNRWAQIGSTHKGGGSDKVVTDGTSQTMSWTTSRAVSWVSIGAIIVPSSSNPVEQAVILWRTYDTDYESSAITISRTAFTDYSETRTMNPNTNVAWTWTEVNALQIGSKASALGSTETIQVSEYWIVVDVAINYELDLEIQWINLNYTRTNEELCIRTGTTDAEDIKVYVWNGSWQLVFSDLAANSWNNISVTTYLTSDTFTVKFLGGTETGDTTQSSWQIDCSLLHTWSVVGEEYERPASQSIGLSLSSARLFGAVRSIAQGINLALSGTRLFEITRTLSQGITLTLSSSKIFETFKTALQSITVTSTVSAFSNFIRTISQSITIALSGARFVDFFRIVIQSLGIALSAERLIDVTRQVSQSIGFALSGLGAFLIERLTSLTINISSSVSIWSEFSRSVSQTFTVSISGIRLVNLLRSVSQAITLTLEGVGEKIGIYSRDAFLTITTLLQSSRLAEWIKSVSQLINISLAAGRLADFVRSVSQTFTMSINAIRVVEIIRQASQSISFALSAIGEKIGLYFGTAQLTVNVTLATSLLGEFFRTISQSLTVIVSASTWTNFFRTISQTINVEVSTLAFREIIRTISQAINVAISVSTLQDLFRTVSQTITITMTGLGEMVGYLFRFVSLEITLTSSVMVEALVLWFNNRQTFIIVALTGFCLILAVKYIYDRL